jgi:DNA-binding transcriptional LysR family regulator
MPSHHLGDRPQRALMGCNVDLELRDLKWAIVTSQHRSLRQAAKALQIRQSTFGRRLQHIERRLGAALFERTNGGTHPTVAGLEFLESAHRNLAETDCALCMLRTRSRGENGRLTLGVYASPSTGNMFATLLEHRHRFPDVEVRTVDGSHDQLLSALANSVVDIAIMTTSRHGWDDRTLPLWSERIIIALHAGHPLSKKAIIRWQELAGEEARIPEASRLSEFSAYMTFET